MSDQQMLDAIDQVTARLRAGGTIGSASETDGAAAEAVRLLRAAGWIESRAAGYAVSERRGAVIGLDLGGTKLRGAIGNAAGDLLAELELPTENHAPDSALAQMAEMVRGLAARAGIPLEAIEHVAVGVPGVVAADGGVVLSPNVTFDRNTPLAETLRATLGVPVSVDNDGNLSAFGELVWGRGREHGSRSLAFLAVGTGIGMGLIVDGHLLHGRGGGAGEIAFLPYGEDPLASAAANPGGSFEAAVGSEGIRRAYAARAGHSAGVREIFERAERGEPDAVAVVDRLVRDIAFGVATVIALLDPGIVVVGGGIGARPGFAEAVGRFTARLTPTACEVVTSALGDRAGVIGALAIACQSARRRLIEDKAPERSAGTRGAAA